MSAFENENVQNGETDCEAHAISQEKTNVVDDSGTASAEQKLSELGKNGSARRSQAKSVSEDGQKKLSHLLEGQLSSKSKGSDDIRSLILVDVPSIINKANIHFQNKNIALVEDVFGTIPNGNSSNGQVRRFTWKNHNDIVVQVINYGARITSMKIPNKEGVVEDVVLGFDDVAGYLRYENHLFGATIGRMTGVVENSTFVIGGKQYWIAANNARHHVDGGYDGLDKVLWNTSVDNTKVILSHVMPENHEGFPGELLVEITYELSTKNEFRIEMEARCSKPTIINLSNLCYFNLAGQNGGRNELCRHSVTINSNSHLQIGKNGLPTGKILNSVFTPYDFQMPVLLKKCKEFESNVGFNQCLCVNREEGEEMCFVARALHVPSGRTLEIYSDQPGVRFTTGNNFEALQVPPLKSILKSESAIKQIMSDVIDSVLSVDEEEIFGLLLSVYRKLKQIDTLEERSFENVLELFKKIRKYDMDRMKTLFTSTTLFKQANIDIKFVITAILEAINIAKNSILANIEVVRRWEELSENAEEVLTIFQQLDSTVRSFTHRVSINYSNKEMSPEEIETTLENLHKELVKSLSSKIVNKTSFKQKSGPMVRIRHPDESKNEIEENRTMDELQQQILKAASGKKASRDISFSSREKSLSQSLKVVGKNGFVYEKQSGMAFQTQNYPNAIYHKNFPDCVLRPNEVYHHKIVYKFWVQSGCPKKWLKRYYK